MITHKKKNPEDNIDKNLILKEALRILNLQNKSKDSWKIICVLIVTSYLII